MTARFRLRSLRRLSGATPHLHTAHCCRCARQETVVTQSLRTYQRPRGVTVDRNTQPGTTSGPLRELRLEEAVALALEKNLDIQVARLEPQSLDFLVAGFRNTYRPIASSTVGLRDQFQLPNSTLSGAAVGQRVNDGTMTYNFGLSQNVNKWGGSYTVNWTNSRRETSNAFSTFNPSFTTNLVAAYVQPLLRGFRIDNVRQQLLVNTIKTAIFRGNGARHGLSDAGQRAKCLLGSGVRAERGGCGAARDGSRRQAR